MFGGYNWTERTIVTRKYHTMLCTVLTDSQQSAYEDKNMEWKVKSLVCSDPSQAAERDMVKYVPLQSSPIMAEKKQNGGRGRVYIIRNDIRQC